ncbi:hypothetical protein RDWZM_001534 [Blomia tropicalis]|uniref:Uncharacterized protein n=1 Tax=Blomia tropicalis TaxID=40697 RepID=A0A9Q0MC41_BLOTA|nr:hypothetical protein RDWZM_001534 [Blomia tropicalis]
MELDDTGNHCRSKRCQHDGHCSNGTHCSDDTKRCECKFGHHLMDNGFQCEPIKCTTYYDCAPLDLNSFCTKEGICQCAKDHRLSGQNICVHQNGKIGFWFCLLSILAVIFIIGSCIAMVQQSFRRAVVAVIPSNIADELDWIEPRTNGTNMAMRQMTPCKHVFDRDEQRQSMSNIMPPPYEVAIKTETFPTTFRVNRMI